MAPQRNPEAPVSPPVVYRGLGALFHSRLGGLCLFGGLFLAVSLILRIVLCIDAASFLAGEWWGVAAAFGVGLFYDLVTFFYVTAPMAVLLLLLPDRLFRWRATRILFTVAYGAMIFLLLFDAAAEWFFWQDFDCRFNFIAVDYLVYPTEVIGNILESYRFWPIVSTLAAMAAVLTALTYRFLRPALQPGSTFRRRLLPAAFFVVPALVAAYPVDSSLAQIGYNRYVDELAKNGLYSFVEAFWRLDLDYEVFYVSRDRPQALGRLRSMLKTPDSRFVSTDLADITRRVERPGPAKRCNLVLILVESLSAQFLGYAGGQNQTPELDKLADKSLLLTQAYSTGTRTVRGLEAVLLSLPPTPGQSVVKRTRQPPVFSLTDLLVQHGYDACFVYGGYGYFDNMNGFMRTHGCRIVDRGDFSRQETTFGNSWGLCDQDLLHRALKEADGQAKWGKPFCQVVLTTSNHRPYTFPPVPGIRPKEGRRGPAVQYTDYAIGEYLRKAAGKPWFDNTIFVIVADHCHNSRGRSEVPVDRYRIPVILHAPRIIRPRRCDALCSQIDLAPTLLGLMNFSYNSRFFGVDVLASPPNRALVGTDQAFGLYKEGILTTIRPVKKVTAFRVLPDQTQKIIEPRGDLLLEAISYFQSAAYLIGSGALSPCDTRIPTTTPAATAPAP